MPPRRRSSRGQRAGLRTHEHSHGHGRPVKDAAPQPPTGRRFPGLAGPVLSGGLTAVVPTHRCGAVPDSHRVPSCLGRRAHGEQGGRTSCERKPTVLGPDARRRAGLLTCRSLTMTCANLGPRADQGIGSGHRPVALARPAGHPRASRTGEKKPANESGRPMTQTESRPLAHHLTAATAQGIDPSSAAGRAMAQRPDRASMIEAYFRHVPAEDQPKTAAGRPRHRRRPLAGRAARGTGRGARSGSSTRRQSAQARAAPAGPTPRRSSTSSPTTCRPWSTP